MTATPPPSGTVTFLFTDIEGSTRLEQQIGTARYAALLERHREILRDAFGAHGGVEQGTEGDSFFVVFNSAREAVAAAIDAQRGLAAEPWPDDAPIRVRMGLHSGEAGMAGGTLVGLDINRAARIAAVAHGGQILVSDTTRALVSAGLPDDLHLRDLGEHRLRDLAGPERLVQVDADDLPGEFPAVRSLDSRPNNLPTQLTTFVGRERELAEALELLSRTRLLTMTGPGGTGKTRLSLQVAAAAAERFPDGVWFVALEPVRDAALVAPTIARALGAQDSSTRPALETLVDAIGERHYLILLDNFEQVLAAGPVVAEILRRCPNVTCLVTTRTALRVSGEQEYPIPGLPAPPDISRLSEMERLNLPLAIRELDVDALNQYEAVRLFIARAVAVRPGFTVTNANAPAVAQICAQLHGMPLAIELAAARIKLLTPDQILARLGHHLALLTAGSRDLPERQQTLRGAIAWSYDLLDEGARRLLDRLSVFLGGCDLETAEAVCGPGTELGFDIFDGLSALVDQSLLRIEEGETAPRFVMTETIAEFASEMLETRGERNAVQERHARVFLDLAERAAPNLSGTDQRLWLDRLERDHDNLRAALDWSTGHPEPDVAARLAFALWRFWQQRGYLNEARRRFETMAAQNWTLEPAVAARFAEAFGGVAYWQADHPAADRWYEEALEIWRRLGDKREIANALYNDAYADILPYMGLAGMEFPEEAAGVGRAKLEEALALYREVGDKAGEGNVLWGLGSYHYFANAGNEAERWYLESLALHRDSGQRTMEAWSLHMLALVTIARENVGPSRDYARHALRHFRDAGDVAGITLVLDDLASIAVAQDDAPRAARLFGGARHLQHTTGTDLANYVEETYKQFDAPSPRGALPPEDFERYGAEGAAMSLDELVAYALEGGDLPEPHKAPTT
ncbi:MAG: adenylate/guanylate cyclase domain-containing protein [Candidatus Limnocylindrales bacterium]|nr:adenylate/guanylate cyclase domain-containing protein [Candidatus Limnocylindrales bacterium]